MAYELPRWNIIKVTHESQGYMYGATQYSLGNIGWLATKHM